MIDRELLTTCATWLNLADTHWEILTSFSAYYAYDILAYPLELARWFATSCVGMGA